MKAEHTFFKDRRISEEDGEGFFLSKREESMSVCAKSTHRGTLNFIVLISVK